MEGPSTEGLEEEVPRENVKRLIAILATDSCEFADSFFSACLINDEVYGEVVSGSNEKDNARKLVHNILLHVSCNPSSTFNNFLKILEENGHQEMALTLQGY